MSNQEIDLLNISEEELSKLKRVDLYNLCIKNRLIVNKSLIKKVYLKCLINQKDKLFLEANRKEKYQLLVGVENRNGAHGYRLPVLTIIQIFRYYWIMCTQPYKAPTFQGPKGYRVALKLVSLNKQFFDIVSQWFNRVQYPMWNVPRSNLSYWCPMKNIQKLTIGHIDWDSWICKHDSSRTIQSLEKLTLTFTFSKKVLSAKSFKNLSILAVNLVSFKPYRIKLESRHFKALSKIPNLVKVDFSNLYETSEFHINSFKLFLEKPMKKFLIPEMNFDLFFNPEKYQLFRNSIEILGKVTYVSASKEGLPSINFPNLRKLYCRSLSGPTTVLDLFDDSTIKNIRHIGLYTCKDGEILLNFLEKLPNLKVIEDLHLNAFDTEKFTNFINSLEVYGRIPSTFIVNSESNCKLDKYNIQFWKPFKFYYLDPK